jgi:TRAP-type C4-dicarboxylate transport system permease small subunit
MESELTIQEGSQMSFLKTIHSFFKGIDWIVEKVSLYALIVSVISMLFLTLITISLRWFDLTFLWMDPLVRHLVFLSAFLGGVVATGEKQHIAIDVFYRLAEKTGHKLLCRILQIIISSMALFTLIWLIKGSIEFVDITFQSEKRPVFLGITRGYLVSIIPVGFGLIAYRFFFLLLTDLINPEGEKLPHQEAS